MQVTMSSSNHTGSSICSNHGRSNTGRRSSSNQKIDQWGQASTAAVAVGAMAVVNTLAVANTATAAGATPAGAAAATGR